jgi:hypothetical protein
VSVSGDDLELGYRRAPILADLARSTAGMVLVLLPLAFLSPPWPVALGLAGLAVLFVVFLHQTWRRRSLRVRLEPDGIVLVGDGDRRRLAWSDLDGLRLRWFGARRVGAGWLDLELRGGGQRIAITSALNGFDLVLERALAAAERNGVRLEPLTRANLEAARGVPPCRPTVGWRR